MARPVPDAIPVALEPQELGPAPLLSIADSGILLAALQRSRKKWLTGMLPKFSTSSKAIQPIQQDPHQLLPLGTCTFSVGPHIFTDTKLFFVKWLPHPASKPPKNAPVPPMTSDLLARLNAEAAKTPMLGNIMRKMSTNTASAHEQTSFNSYVIALHHAMHPPPPRTPSMVLEFRENPIIQWILPQDFSAQPTSATTARLAFVLQPALAAPPKAAPGRPLPPHAPQEPVTYLVEGSLSDLGKQAMDGLVKAAKTAPPPSPLEPLRCFLHLQKPDVPAMAAASKRTKNAVAGPSTAKAPAGKAATGKAVAKKSGPKKLRAPVDPVKAAERKAKREAKKREKQELAGKRATLEEGKPAEEDEEQLLQSIKSKPTARQAAKRTSSVPSEPLPPTGRLQAQDPVQGQVVAAAAPVEVPVDPALQ